MCFSPSSVDDAGMRLWLFVLLVGCRSSNDAHAPAPVVGQTSASALPVVTATPPVGTPPCAVVASLAITPKSVTSLENVRVVHGPRTVVTWQDADTAPRMGDSSISANAAWVDWSPSPHAAIAELPYRAYASAEYSRIGPTRGASGVDLFTFGIAGSWTFMLYDQDETTWRRLDINANAPKAVKTLTVNMAVREDFAVAESAPVAAVAGWETPCPSYYACDQIYQPAMEKGFVDSVRVVDLAAGRSEIIWKSSGVRSNKKTFATLAPAIAMGKTKGAVAFRVDQSIQLASLDASFHPSTPAQIASGDVGAPAIAFDGDRPVVVWAQRASKTDPYHLVVWTGGAAHDVNTGTASAFAPALAVRDGTILLAWMEGDADKHGVVRMTRAPLSGSWDFTAASTLSDSDGNARDPEISMQGDEAVLVWSQISQASRIEVRKLGCPAIKASP
jgi:hypothetical protein